MIKINAFVLAAFALLLSSCQAIGDIFKAGVWVGILIVIVIIVVLIMIFRRKS
jgi:hypothetical protein